jgi:hypothetical protein
MATDNLPPGVTASMVPHVRESDPRDDDRLEDAFDVTLTGEQIQYVLKALPFYRCHANRENSGETLTTQDRQAIRAIEAEVERVWTS